MTNFRKKLLNLMTENDLTVRDLSDAINVSRISIFHWRSGKRMPSTRNMVKLAKYFGGSLESLIVESTAQREVAV